VGGVEEGRGAAVGGCVWWKKPIGDFGEKDFHDAGYLFAPAKVEMPEPPKGPWDYEPKEGDVVWVRYRDDIASLSTPRVVYGSAQNPMLAPMLCRGAATYGYVRSALKAGFQFVKAEVSPPPAS
jgi:hypothetical protein